MKSLRLLVLLFSFYFVSNSVSAQVDLSTASESVLKIAKHNAKKWKEKLMLSINQTKYMEERMTAFEMEKSKIYTSDSDMEEKNASLTSLSDKLHAGMGDILTPDQYEAYKTEIKEISGQ